MLIPIRPKESKLERFERLEAIRLATRPEVHYCGYLPGSGTGVFRLPEARTGKGCGYRLTTHPSGLCRACQRWNARR